MTKLTKQDEIEYFLGCLKGANTADRGTKFRKALFEVLTQIWDGVEDEVHKIGAIIFADVSSLFLLYCPHKYQPLPSEKEVCIVEKYIIFFPNILCDEPESEIKHTIAHEFAHFMLGHEEVTNREEHEKGEKAADDLAAKWGFPTKRGGEKV